MASAVSSTSRGGRQSAVTGAAPGTSRVDLDQQAPRVVGQIGRRGIGKFVTSVIIQAASDGIPGSRIFSDSKYESLIR